MQVSKCLCTTVW